jgi:hypothetical protein
MRCPFGPDAAGIIKNSPIPRVILLEGYNDFYRFRRMRGGDSTLSRFFRSGVPARGRAADKADVPGSLGGPAFPKIPPHCRSLAAIISCAIPTPRYFIEKRHHFPRFSSFSHPENGDVIQPYPVGRSRSGSTSGRSERKACFPARVSAGDGGAHSGRMGVEGHPVSGKGCQRLSRLDFFIQDLCCCEQATSNTLPAGKFWKGEKCTCPVYSSILTGLQTHKFPENTFSIPFNNLPDCPVQGVERDIQEPVRIRREPAPAFPVLVISG